MLRRPTTHLRPSNMPARRMTSSSDFAPSVEPRSSPQEAGLVRTIEDQYTEEAIQEILRNVSNMYERSWVSRKGSFNRPDTVLFTAVGEAELDERTTKVTITENIPDQMVYFKIPKKAVEWSVVRLAFIRAGVKRVRGEQWNMLWGKHIHPQEYQLLNAFQKVNHFPGSSHLGRKDRLAILLEQMVELWGDEFSFVPKTYVLPEDASRLKHDVQRKIEAGEDPLLIKKPPASSCGRNISVLRASEGLPLEDDCVVQHYVADPFLINDFKFDLRLYVAVTSYNPLRIYLYSDGLTRFATQPYSTSETQSRMMHLTNYSVNKFSPLFVKNTDSEEDMVGSKWSIRGLRQWFADNNIDDTQMWRDIEDVIIKTLISAEGIITPQYDAVATQRNSCFELYGFDVMVDKALKPWLIEVNLLPSLACESPLDKKIKNAVINDLFNLVGMVQYDRRNYPDEAAKLGLQGNLIKSRLDEELATVADHLESHVKRELGNDDILTLQETLAERERRGSFEPIYPVPGRTAKYAKYFGYDASPRNNLLLATDSLYERFSAETIARFVRDAAQ